MDAAQIAGLNCLRLMNETTAGTKKHNTLYLDKEVCESLFLATIESLTLFVSYCNIYFICVRDVAYNSLSSCLRKL